MVQALTTWHINVVHIGLNEDCLLDINGVDPGYAGANYMNAITASSTASMRTASTPRSA